MARSSVDMSKFTAAMRQLAQFSGEDMRTVVTAEAGKVLETAVRYTPKANTQKIKEQVTKDTEFRFKRGQSDAGTRYETKDGKIWFRPGREEEWFLISKWKIPPKLWAVYLRVLASDAKDLAATLARRVRDALARRGLTAKTWVQIGRAIGATVNAPGYVEKANTPAAIGTGGVVTNASECTVSGENRSDVLIKTRTGQGIIDRALKARAKFVEIAFKKGALNSLKSRTRSFPHLFKP